MILLHVCLLLFFQSSVRSSPLPSQSTAVSTDEIDVTVKISERIEKQLAELDKAPRKKVHLW